MLTEVLLALALTAPIGCADDGEDEDDDNVPEVGDEIGEDPPEEVCKSSCGECKDLMKDAHACMAVDEFEAPIDSFSCIVCDNDGLSAALSCETQANLQSVSYSEMDTQVMPCRSPTVIACIDWSPARHVHQVSDREWEVERDLVTALVADPSRLVGCDSARVKFSNGSYRVTSLDSDDLLARLGLVDGDVIQSVDDHAISGPADVALAFFKLWPDTREFTVSVLRPGVGALTFTYKLV